MLENSERDVPHADRIGKPALSICPVSGDRWLASLTLSCLDLINVHDTVLFVRHSVDVSVDLSIALSVGSWRDVVGQNLVDLVG